MSAEIGDPGYYSVDSVYFSGFSLAFPQEGKAVKRNEHGEKRGFAGDCGDVATRRRVQTPSPAPLFTSVVSETLPWSVPLAA